MASGLVRSTLSNILTDYTFTGTSERSKVSCQQVIALLDKVAEDSYCDLFEEFSSKLLTCLQSLLSTPQNGSVDFVVHSKREQLWTIFHQKRTTEIANLWKTFLQSVQLDLDALVYQMVNQALYEDKIKAHFAAGSSITKSSCIQRALNREEECILRYAAGYVPFVLLRKYEKCVSESSVQFIECLSKMVIFGEETDFLKYTRAWIEQVNREGLFEINDTAYMLFKEIELNLQDNLQKHLQRTTPDSTKEQTYFICCSK